MRAGMTVWLLAISARLARRGSGTATSPTLGSIVQKGKFAACAAAVRVSALKSVDFPTFGNPTIPVLKPMTVVLCGVRVGLALRGAGCKGTPDSAFTEEETQS